MRNYKNDQTLTKSKFKTNKIENGDCFRFKAQIYSLYSPLNYIHLIRIYDEMN